MFLYGFFFALVTISSIAVYEVESRILNGRIAKKGQFPYMISVLAYIAEGDSSLLCSFSLISTKTCLGAAHCVIENGKFVDIKNICGIIGFMYESKDHPCRKCSRIIEYESIHDPNDVVRLVFENEVVLGDNVQPVILAGPKSDITHESVIVIGWGAINCDGEDNTQLRYGFLQVVELSVCNSSYEVKLSPGFICLYKRGAGSCVGDSGGPVIRNGTNVQIGIINFGVTYCDDLPSVSIDVRILLDWIKRNAERKIQIED